MCSLRFKPQCPAEVPQGPVRLIVLIPKENATTMDALAAAMDAVCTKVDTRAEVKTRPQWSVTEISVQDSIDAL